MINNTALTAQDVADMLKISKNTVYELIKRGELTSYKVGRKVRFNLKDVESYIAGSKNPAAPKSLLERPSPSHDSFSAGLAEGPVSYSSEFGSGFIICGQDPLLDVLSNYIERYTKGIKALRSYTGSYNSLTALYHGQVQAASTHLWDGDTGQYNVPYVRRLLPGIPTLIVHLACRTQGFYVAKGNPKNIKTWSDLKRPDITMINREKGAGSRILLDEHLRLLGISGSSISGYKRESQSHLTVASTIARGGADVAVGDQKIARQINNIDFIPLQKERYELVFKKEDMGGTAVQAILDILHSDEFKLEFQEVDGYDITEMGHIVAET